MIPRRGLHSLRVRLTALVTLTSAVAIILGLLAMNSWLSAKIDESVNTEQRQRVNEIITYLRAGNTDIPKSEPFAQVIVRRADGRYVVLTRTVAVESSGLLLTPAQLTLAATQELRIDGRLEALGGRARLLATPQNLETSRLVIVVGSSLSREDDTKGRLAVAFLIAGFIMVALIAAGGWALIGAALRPVRRMTDEAASITGANLDRRLVVPGRTDEISHLGSTLNGMLQRIESSVRRERAFVDDASHELRTPLTIMRGELELALAHPGDGPETEATLRSLLDEVERLTHLAEDLLVLARAGAPERDPHSFGTELLTAATMAAGRVGRAGHNGLISDRHIHVDVSGDATMVAAPQPAVERIVTNLLTNAQRFATSSVRIWVGLSADDPRFAEIVVQDDGPGFPEEFLPRAFERLAVSSGSRTRSHGGTGLGLAIVEQLATTWGGTATATNHSVLGGAVLRVRLPMSVDANPAAD